ncbi:glycoside hydrolase family 76 protein [Aspergillus clavatus NRRL 1]|uniref:Mannan endo-1,6-alpha-mannosidase n=1 Tax=Aspergillus clavatus (strain ATCC 1007 / CBS 513.65 / DSM 816 / NCTC 3887 / NRRL 1 / QM 1276 / 107) TaxID=344612 RepID=A1CD27_ASPCL|nr:glycosyl hydrolase family 76 protein [Aspergillus clavatus NRRL 1]EAW12434.1 glycosyl hydrolase family 76 protein [Aspergillus clavatus NRRL 1]
MRWLSLRQLCGATLLLLQQVALADLGIQANNVETLKSAGKDLAAPMMDFYKKNQTEGIPGKLTGTWYVAGAMFMTLIQYWQASGDDTYNSIVSHDLMFQSGENYDFFSKNYSQWLGNDDQMFWGLASITASETGFPDISGKPTWTSLARVVFNMQVERWDRGTCDGGMRWQIWPYQAGYTMKNAISNGGLFELSARLARFTKNGTYADWAEKIWDWSVTTPLLQTDRWYIADSTSNEANCKDAGNTQWSYNYGTYLSGASFMYNYTNGDQKWLNRVNGLLDSLLATFSPKQLGGNVLSEVACEPIMTCDRNQLGFKGYVAMWLAQTSILVPSTADRIYPVLQGSALAISKQCSAPDNTCGMRWYQPTWDGYTPGLETQMAALAGVTSNLMFFKSAAPKTIESNPDGKEHQIATPGDERPDQLAPINTGDRAGAWILTVVIVVLVGGSVGWLIKT